MTRWLDSPTLRELAENRWGPSWNWNCVYCGRSIRDGHVDHFVPRERGGADLPWNLVPACGPCNRSKSDHDPVAWMEAAGIPAATIDQLTQITRSPRWTRADVFTSTPLTIYYSRVRVPATVPPLLLLPRNLAEVLVLDPDAWAPVTAIRRVIADYLADRGLPPLSSQQLNRELGTRGLPRTTRKGVPGYPGFYVSDETAAAGKLRAGSRATRASRERVRKDRRNHVDQVITSEA